jgi:hypothetical protein
MLLFQLEIQCHDTCVLLFFYFNENLIIINNTSINQGITSKNEQITFSWEDHEKMVERQ